MFIMNCQYSLRILIIQFHRYEGSIGPASRAMAAADQLTWQLGRKNL